MDDYLAEIFRSGRVYGATPKIDGIRCITALEGDKTVGLSRTLKLIPNRYIQSRLSSLPPHLDGELTVGKTFQAATSGIMSYTGEPHFTYHVFGCMIDQLHRPYRDVAEALRLTSVSEFYRNCLYVNIFLPKVITSLPELLDYEDYCLANGAEGVMLRDMASGYKYGRSTLSDGKLIAIKRFVDSEARVVGWDEMLRNLNEQTTNALGLSERSSHAANLCPAGMLGALQVEDLYSGVRFSIGSGFTETQRQNIWNNRKAYLNRIVKYKSQPHGVKLKPRAPIFLGWRDVNDL